MDTSFTQAAVLAAIRNSPGITGPDLLAEVSEFIPAVQYHQHLGRLVKRGLIDKKRIENGVARVELSLTKAGEKELDKCLPICKFVIAKIRKT
jgi:DNA-binding MarR family transcriptional regulator